MKKKKKSAQETPAEESTVAVAEAGEAAGEAAGAEESAADSKVADATGTEPVETDSAGPSESAPEATALDATALEATAPEGTDGAAPVQEAQAPESQTPDEQAPEPAPMDAAQAAEQFEVESKADAGETEDARLRAMLEAIVYVLEEPLPAAQIAQALGQPLQVVEKALAELVAESSQPGRGLQIREVAGGFKMSTKPEFHEEIRTFVKKLKPTFKLSQAALETLAVIAYKQPITAPEILEIRGVQGGGVLKTLLERKLVTAAGRKQVVGKPVLYKTTKEFLVQFGLRDLNELPTLKEFEEWSRLAIEEANAEADQAAKAAGPPPESQANASEEPAAQPEPAGEPASETAEASPSEAPEPVQSGERPGSEATEPAVAETASPESAEPAGTELSEGAEPVEGAEPAEAAESQEANEASGKEPERSSAASEEPLDGASSPVPEATTEPTENAMPEEPVTNEEHADKPPPEILDGRAETGDDANKPPPEILDGSVSVDK